MRVAVLGFGSVWRRRFGKDANDPKRFLRSAYYNTTGVTVGGHIRTRPKLIGHVRFNGIGGFDPDCPERMLNRVFGKESLRCCSSICCLTPNRLTTTSWLLLRIIWAT